MVGGGSGSGRWRLCGVKKELLSNYWPHQNAKTFILLLRIE